MHIIDYFPNHFINHIYKLIFIIGIMLSCFRTLLRRSFTQTPLPQISNLRGLYLDYQATTPIDYRVLDAMLPFMTQNFGNPHSKSHEFGWNAETAVEKARQDIAKLINCNSKQIIFTSGATESNNMSLKGLADFYGKNKKHIITTQIEHKCILDSCRNLELKGFKVTYLPVQTNGLLDLEKFKELLDTNPEDILVCSIMMVNNEIGVVQNVGEIGKMCRERGIFFHTDGAQAVGKIPVDVDKMNIDLMSISGHKIYGPKGIGALYVRRKPRVRLAPLFSGGGQERGFRSGTVPANLAVGLGKACQIAQRQMESDRKHVEKLYNRLMTGIRTNLTHFQVNGDEVQRYLGNANISFACIEGESLIMSIKTCAVSSGSACTSESLEPSYVLRALGVEQEMAHTSIRIGIGRFTTEEEIDYLISELTRSVNRLRDLSPLWEMMKEGIDIKTIDWTQPH